MDVDNQSAILAALALVIYLWWRANQFAQQTPDSSALVFGTAPIQYGTSGLTPYPFGGRC